jgi:hypothetical protein
VYLKLLDVLQKEPTLQYTEKNNTKTRAENQGSRPKFVQQPQVENAAAL